MKVRKIVSMLCVIAIIASACMFNVIAESTTGNSFTLSLAGLNASDYNAEEYKAIDGNSVVSLKVKKGEYVAQDAVKTNKNNNGNETTVIKITPKVAGTVTITFSDNTLSVNTEEKKNSVTIEKSQSPYSFEVTEDDINAGTSWYIMGGAGDATKITQIQFTAKSDETTATPTPEPSESNSFILDLTNLTADNYNKDAYVDISNGVSLKSASTYISTSGIKMVKNANKIKFVPVVDGTVVLTHTSTDDNCVMSESESRKNEDPAVTSGVAVKVESGTTYYFCCSTKNSFNLTQIQFTAKSDEPTGGFSAAASNAVVSGTDVTDGSTATGFTATVTNNGIESSSFSKINWTVTSNTEIGKKAVNLGTVTLYGGATATYGLIIVGLHDSSATADVTVE